MLLSAILASRLRWRSVASANRAPIPNAASVNEPAQDGAPGDGDSVQGTENSIETNQAHAGNPNGKADGAGPDDEPPLTKSLSQSVTEKHSRRARINGVRLSAEAFF